jgi:mannose-6-phosphate isomerase-like protein (cupin superfamily)
MADYTKTNLMDVEDSAPGFGFAPDLEARFANEALELTTSGMAYERLQPGKRTPFGHAHSQQEEVYVIVEGSGRIKLDDEIHEVGRLDAIRIGRGVMRCMEAGDEGIGYVAVGAPPIEGDKRAEVEMVPGWWSD